MRTVVILQLLLTRKNRLFIDQLDDGLFSADADGIRGRASTTCGERVEGVLGSAVFQGMERDDCDSAARIQMVSDRFQRRLNDGYFGVDLDADRLKRLFGGMVSDSE